MRRASCDIIIPIFNGLSLTRNCLESVEANTDSEHRLILIDNGSDGETKNFLKDFESKRDDVVIVENKGNLGWVKAVNQGLLMSTSAYVCIMNNDTVVRTKDWIRGLIEVAEMEAVIGLVNPYFEAKRKSARGAPFIEVDFCRGYCVLIKRAVIERIGLLDESYGMGYYDDDDYSVRAIQAGFRCVRANGVFVEHMRDSTFSTVFGDEARRLLHERNKALFYSKWGRRLKTAFILTSDVDRETLSELLFSVARRQHIVYLWNSTRLFGLQHINIRERAFPRFLHRSFASAVLLLNRMKKPSKRYDLTFIDKGHLNGIFDDIGTSVYYVDVRKDLNRINAIIDSAARM